MRVFWGERASSERKLGLCRLLKAAVEVHNARVRTPLDTNWQQTCVKLSSEIGSASDNHRILTKNLKRKKIYAQWVPHNLIRGTHVTIHGNHQTAPERESILHWILTAYVIWAHLHESWAKKTVNCMALPSNMSTKISTESGSAKSHVQCSLQLWGYSPHTSRPSWQYSKRCLLQKPVGKSLISPSCVASNHISYSQDKLCYMVKLTVTLPSQWLICLKDGNGKFWYMHCTDQKWAHIDYNHFKTMQKPMHGICFRTRGDIKSAN